MGRLRIVWLVGIVLCLVGYGLPAFAQVSYTLTTGFDSVPDELDINFTRRPPKILREGDDAYLRLEADSGTHVYFQGGALFHDFNLRLRLRMVGGVLRLITNTGTSDCRAFNLVVDAAADRVSLNRFASCTENVLLDTLSTGMLAENEWIDLDIALVGSTITVTVNNEGVLTGTTPMTHLNLIPQLRFDVDPEHPDPTLDITEMDMRGIDARSSAPVETETEPSEGRTSRDSEPEVEEEPEVVITNFDPTGTQQAIIDSLRVMGYLPDEGGSYLFGEDYAYFFGQGNWFTPLASRSPRTDVVMAGDLTFTYGESDELQSCSLMAHVSVDGTGTTTQLLQAGIDNAGYAYIFDVASDDDVDYYDDFINFESGDTVHLLLIVISGNTSLFIDGEPVLDREKTDNRSGSYGISLTGRTPDDGCEGRNIWVWSFDE